MGSNVPFYVQPSVHWAKGKGEPDSPAIGIWSFEYLCCCKYAKRFIVIDAVFINTHGKLSGLWSLIYARNRCGNANREFSYAMKQHREPQRIGLP